MCARLSSRCCHALPCHSVEWIGAQISQVKLVALHVQLSPLIDRTVLKTVKAAFGGRVRFVVSGGAPLGPSVETFLNITLCCPVLQVCSCLITPCTAALDQVNVTYKSAGSAQSVYFECRVMGFVPTMQIGRCMPAVLIKHVQTGPAACGGQNI